jgi:hypothetical protein
MGKLGAQRVLAVHGFIRRVMLEKVSSPKTLATQTPHQESPLSCNGGCEFIFSERFFAAMVWQLPALRCVPVAFLKRSVICFACTKKHP